MLLRVGFCISRARDYSCAWDSAFPERWTIPARRILHFSSGGLLLRVRFCIFRAVDESCAWDSAFPERWAAPVREILHLWRGGPLLRRGFCILLRAAQSRGVRGDIL